GLALSVAAAVAGLPAQEPADNLWRVRAVLNGHKRGIFVAAFTPDGKTVVSGSCGFNKGVTGEAKLWDVATGKERATLEGHTGPIMALAISPDGKTLATGCILASDGDTIQLWDVTTGKELAVLRSKDRYGITALAFAPDGKTLLSA